MEPNKSHPATTSQLRVLVVEDEALVRLLIVTHLADQDFQ
jgi:CheY-like chemotaxis protein